MISYSVLAASILCAPLLLSCPLRSLVSRSSSLLQIQIIRQRAISAALANMDEQSKRALENLHKQRSGLRLLSIQSHVVSGYVGNKCSVFLLQLHGFEVDFVNSVQFSNHTGYEKYSHILTGYCGDASFLRGISSIVKDVKSQNPGLIYVCDPVQGDDGKYYVPEELTDIYRNEILPLADIITPNVFELSKLTKLPVTTEAECLRAVKRLHKESGVRVIVVTSGILAEKCPNIFYCYSSEMSSNGSIEQHRFEIPIVRGHFVGTGDVFTSLLVVWLTEFNGNIKEAICSVISSMQAILKRTSAAAFGNLLLRTLSRQPHRKSFI
uniref:Pyridoxal kinase n=1 Tax=Ditylenchus dipsaci TaxID=166011 RepID=A0A915EJK3_9BILA